MARSLENAGIDLVELKQVSQSARKECWTRELLVWNEFLLTRREALEQAMGPSLARVQSAIIDCMDACLVEIRKSNKIDCSGSWEEPLFHLKSHP